MFLVEQNAFHALKLAHRGYVMVNGLITLSGTGRELLERPEVKSAYLEGGRANRWSRRESRQGLAIYEEGSFGVFLLVTVILGGGAAWLAGRAIAADLAAVVAGRRLYADPGCAVRFIHFALFGGTLLSPHYYLVDGAVCLAFGFARLPRRTGSPDGHAIIAGSFDRRPAALAPQAAADVTLASRSNCRLRSDQGNCR